MQVIRFLLTPLVLLAVAHCGARGELSSADSDGGTSDNWPPPGGATHSGGATPYGGAGAASSSGGDVASGGVPSGGGVDSGTQLDGGAGGPGKLKLQFDAGPAVDSGPPPFAVVDGGTDCQLESLGATFVYQSCCNSTPCRGECVLFNGETTPVCYCAGIVGGCPAPHHCCMATHCGWADYCT